MSPEALLARAVQLGALAPHEAAAIAAARLRDPSLSLPALLEAAGLPAARRAPIAAALATVRAGSPAPTAAAGPPAYVPGATVATPAPSPASPLAAGRARVGGYEVVRELARGGMGVVLVGRDPGLDRLVAIKLLQSEADPRAQARFEREAQAAARLDVPGVVRVHAFGRDGDRCWLVMDLVEGRSLAALLAEEGALAPERAVRITAKVARTLAACHARGVLHRDMKPSNVLLRAGDEPIVTDFGLARDARADRLTRTGESLGTPAFMPPEQVDGLERTDARTDVYGLGATLWTLLVGRDPFIGPTPLAVLTSSLKDRARPPSAHRRGIPAALDAVVLRCLEKDPAQRFVTATELAEALEKLLPSLPRLVGSWPRRRTLAAALVVAGLSAALAARGTIESPAAPVSPPAPAVDRAPGGAPAAAPPSAGPSRSASLLPSLERARDSWRSGHVAAVVSACDEALSIRRDSELLLLRSKARLHLEELSGARADAEAAGPGGRGLLRACDALAADAEGLPEECIEAATEALRLDPDQPAVRLARARRTWIARALVRPDIPALLEELEPLCRWPGPTQVEACRLDVRVLLESRGLNGVIDDEPTRARALARFDTMAGLPGSPERQADALAWRALLRLAAVTRRRPYPRAALGLRLRLEGPDREDAQRSLEDCDRAVELHADVAGAHHTAAEALLALDRAPEARARAELWLARAPADVRCVEVAVRASMQLEELDAARSTLERASAHAPAEPAFARLRRHVDAPRPIPRR